MQKYRKTLLFFLGFLFIPEILSKLTALVLGLYDDWLLTGYFAFVFLLIYFTFPVLYCKDMPKRFPNKYAFYGLLYLIFWVFGVVLVLFITM